MALGTPRELIARSGQGARLEVRLAKPVGLDHLRMIEGVIDCHEADGAYFLHASRQP